MKIPFFITLFTFIFIQPHKYIIQAEVLKDSWPLSEASWAFVQMLKELEKNELKGTIIFFSRGLHYTKNCTKFIRATSGENLFLPYANNKGADQTTHPRSLISTFVVRCLDSVIPKLSKSNIPRL